VTPSVTPWLWAVFTVIAAFMQTLRNAMQRELTTKLGTVGATHVRFLFGFPFVIVFLVGVMLATGASLPRPGLLFWPWAILGAFAQVAFEAIDLNDVSTAVLTYFVYPLLTGIAAAATGLERLRWQGIACALAAFGGLAIMIGAHPAGLVLAGIAFALAAAACRTGVLIITRAFLVGADARLTTWYSVIAQAAIFLALSAITQTWQPPQNNAGWAALVGMSLATTAAIVFIFVSTMRVGPFRTALIMNLEPLIAMVGSAWVLGDTITPLQGLGSAIMLAALVAFQLLK